MAPLKTDPVTQAKLDNITQDITEIKSILNANYVTRDAFEPVRLLVYGLTGVLLLAIVGALAKLVILVR